jgi:hypothetical protein
MKSRRWGRPARRRRAIPMREGWNGRRFAGLTTLLLGLTAIFASLTLVAIGRLSLAAGFSIGGLVLSVLGLRWLPSGAP